MEYPRCFALKNKGRGFFLLLLVLTLGESTSGEVKFNGSAVLEIFSESQRVCTGVRVSSETILTAKHCLKRDVFLKENGKTLPLSASYPVDSYDLVVVRLPQPSSNGGRMLRNTSDVSPRKGDGKFDSIRSSLFDYVWRGERHDQSSIASLSNVQCAGQFIEWGCVSRGTVSLQHFFPRELNCQGRECILPGYLPPGGSGCPLLNHRGEVVAISYGWSRKGIHAVCAFQLL